MEGYPVSSIVTLYGYLIDTCPDCQGERQEMQVEVKVEKGGGWGLGVGRESPVTDYRL